MSIFGAWGHKWVGAFQTAFSASVRIAAEGSPSARSQRKLVWFLIVAFEMSVYIERGQRTSGLIFRSHNCYCGCGVAEK